ncbi:hypothetical protein [Salsuginibacillus kocurii]|nr:hypothetical protein [Salsuginibacillus kocurii]
MKRITLVLLIAALVFSVPAMASAETLDLPEEAVPFDLPYET